MKKTFVALSCAFSLCLISCASKPETEDSQLSEIQNETELEQNQNEDESQSEEQSSSDEKNTDENTDASEEELNALTSTPSSSDFPEPDFFEEPEIITLEPEEEKPVVKVSDEPVEKEEPPVLETIETKETNDDSNAYLVSDASDSADTTDSTDTDASSNSTSSSNTDVANSVIDITDDEYGYDAYDENDKSALPKVITPSRSVTLKKFEYLDVAYPGTGWVYMGLTDNSKDIAYFGRKLGTKDTKFSLQARNAGTKIVHFYKNDPLTGRYLDDYLEVIILSENGSNKTHIEAPEYKLPVQKKETPVEAEAVSEETTEEKVEEKTAQTTAAAATASAEKSTAEKASTEKASTEKASTEKASTEKASTEKAAEKTDTAKATATVSSEEVEVVETVAPAATTTISNTATLLQEAQVLYNEKEYAAALAKLNQFFEYSTDDRDEALYLKGQILEAKSEIRDIKGAIDAYTSLTKNYPASKLWDSANKRIIYLKRFYLEVR